MNFRNLDEKAKLVAANYKRCERELLAVISQIDKSKAFYKLGYSSLFSYITKQLKLSEAVACNISAVVRKSYEVPQLQQKVVAGELSLSKARKLTPVITQENHKVWLEVAQRKNQKQIEREVSLAQPKTAVPEKVNYTNKSIPEKIQVKRNVPRIKVELGVSETLMLQVRRCQDLESQRQKKSVSLEGCLQALVNCYIDKKDPLKKAQRQRVRGRLESKTPDVGSSVSDRKTTSKETRKTSIVSGKQRRPKNRTPIPMKVKHRLQLRDQGQCTYRDQHGRRCETRRHLEIHHVKPVHAGGDHSLENLRLLCHGHHKMEHLER